MTKVAVVILNWNGKKLLEQFLPSLIKYTLHSDVEIVVADNASTDTSLVFMKENYSSTVRVIELNENFGFAEGYNQTLAQIDAEYFVLLNSDVEVTDGWLNPMIEYLDKNKDVVAAQPKFLSYNDKTKFEYAGAAGGYIDKLGFPFCRGRLFDSVENDNAQYDEVKNVFWASGACMLVRANDYFEDGGLDANFFAHMEEIDLCWRFRARSKRIVCIPQSVVYHIGGATLDEESAHKVYLNFRNNMLMLFKNLEPAKLNWTISKRILYNKIAGFKYLLEGRKDKFTAISQAHKDFKSLRADYFNIREENIKKTTLTNIPEVYHGNIVLDYYLRGKRKFSDIWYSSNTN